jgi:hypothetical protein
MRQVFNQMVNEAVERDDYVCTIDCTEPAHLSPNTMITPAEQHSTLLKARAPLREGRIRDQGVGGSNPLAPTI